MATTGQVQLCEVGLRDGLQYERVIVSTEAKLTLINGLLSAGLRRIQVASFVHPTRVPQMADAEAVVAGCPSNVDAVFSGLALNSRGVRRAAESGLKCVDLSIATNERHSRDNANMSVGEGIAHADVMIDEASAVGMQIQLNLQTVFGYAVPGDTPRGLVVDLARRFAGRGLESFSLADSTGMANPTMIRDTIRAVQDVLPETPLVLHLHDTRGLGLANAYAAFCEGVRRFDSSFGGLGGCPFIPGATGNVCTEDVAYMFNTAGFETGIRPESVADVSLEAERILGRQLPGKLTTLRRMEAPITVPAH